MTFRLERTLIILLAAIMPLAGCTKKSPTQQEAATPPITIEMVSIPAGSFIMGGQPTDPYPQTAAQPQDTIYLAAYQIGKCEITNAQFKAFIDSGGYGTSDYWSTAGWNWRTGNSVFAPYWWASGQHHCGPSFPSYPVVGITWYEADAFARWAWKRLPTEAEWEKAARGTDARYWPWGNSWDSTRCNSGSNAPPDTFAESAPVGRFTAGASPCGALDMAGNVAEFVSDWFDSSYYHVAPDSNPSGPTSGTMRVIRGGGFSFPGYMYQCYWRESFDPASIRSDVGFRVAE